MTKKSREALSRTAQTQPSSRGRRRAITVDRPGIEQFFRDRVVNQQFMAQFGALELQEMEKISVEHTDKKDVIENQLRFLKARHLFIADRMKPVKIAAEIGVDTSSLFEWIDMYGWREHQMMFLERRNSRYMLAREVNSHVIEKQTDRIFALIQNATIEMLGKHMDGDMDFTPSDLKSLADVAKTAFEVRGAITGSDKIGEKLEVHFTADLRTSIEKMVQTVTAPPRPISAAQRALEITIEDAEFEAR